MSKKLMVILCMFLMNVLLVPTYSFAASDENNTSLSRTYIEGTGRSYYQIGIASVSCDPIETVENGVTVTHCAGREYNSTGTLWRAHAWTTAVENGSDKYHYTRARVVNALIPSIIYKDSDRVWGYSKTTATTDYVEANEPLFSMRSYWGF